ncbi:MAG TPA: tryptophan--tRNA ligase [Clostridiales bacterium]|nr:tryptophan--tRNA ligase [Clostridiales bacterium]
MSKKRVMSGMRPTGSLHLGNYFGALENWVKLQDEYDCFYSIVDWHALTTAYEDTSNIKENIFEIAIDWLSAGLDPDKCTIYIQSSIKEIAELHLILSMIVPLSWLERCPTYKDQLNQLKDKHIATYGFLGYPCLQAADILICNAQLVPVGEDQLPHLELSREIVRRFNYLYGEVFNEPQAILNEVKVLPGLDGRKMSKSYQNTITLSDSPEDIKNKVKVMVTDPARIRKTDPGHPSVCSVYAFHKVFSDKDIDTIKEQCTKGAIGCVQCKKMLADNMIKYLEPIYTKRKEIEQKPYYVREVLENGTKKATKIAKHTMGKVREAVKINI